MAIGLIGTIVAAGIFTWFIPPWTEGPVAQIQTILLALCGAVFFVVRA